MGPGTGLNGDELMAVTNDWAVAIVSNDAARIAALMADEWVIVSDSGISPKEEFLSLVASGELTHSAMELVGDARVRIYGMQRSPQVA